LIVSRARQLPGCKNTANQGDPKAYPKE
jgi:hypothetical protein